MCFQSKIELKNTTSGSDRRKIGARKKYKEWRIFTTCTTAVQPRTAN